MYEYRAALRRTSLLVAMAGALVLSGYAAAQTAPPTDQAKKEENKDEAAEKAPIAEVVVTGSRVRRDEFTSAAPVQVITRNESVLAGLTTTAEILQGSTATGGSNQINNYFGGFVVDGGPGVNTVNLRGLGAVRTLVLLNGRRLAPAGTRGSVGSADLNVLPNSIVERIEILKDGASSVYGSDAVAGVVNIITKRGIDGWTVEGAGTNTFDGGGDQLRASLSGGLTGDRFEISGSLEFAQRGNLTVGDRDWSSCSTEYLIDPATGDRLDQRNPLTGLPKCFPISGLSGTNGLAHNYIVSSVPMAGARWEPDPGSTSSLIPGWKNVDIAANRAPFPKQLLQESLISPVQNYTAFVNGSFDLGRLGDAEIYFEALGARRESVQVGSRQLSLDYVRGSPLVPEPFRSTGGGLGLIPAGQALGGQVISARALVAWGTDQTSQQVDFWRGVVGIRGDLTFLDDWKYDASLTHNLSTASYTFESFLTNRVYNSTDVVVAPVGTTLPTRTVNGVAYTCRINTVNANAGCVPAPPVGAPFLRGEVDDAYRRYMFVPVVGKTIFEEATLSAIFDGSLFSMPAGKVKGAVGLEYRTDRLNDTPSTDSINQNLYNLTSGGQTAGDDSVSELFAEVEFPLLRNMTMAKDLTLNVSGRYTDYESYGSDTTYKVGLSYTPVNWFKLRATKGTSYRAPGLFEQFLSPTSGFISAQNDPCNQYGNLPPSSARFRNCSLELPGQGATFIQSSGIRVNAAGGAAQGIASETSDAQTLGLVLQPELPAIVGDLQFAVDWWKIEVDNQIDRIGGGGLLSLCYDDPDFRAGGRFCSFVDPRGSGNTLTVQDNFINIASQVAEGLDFNIRYTREIGIGELRVDLEATKFRRQDNKLFPTDPFDELNGTLFAPEYVGQLRAQYTLKEWTFFYNMDYIGKMDSNELFGVDPTVDPFILNTAEYITHDASIRYRSKNKWEITVGVANLTDEEPQKISAGATSLRQGDALLYSGYDFFGRTGFVNFSKSF